MRRKHSNKRGEVRIIGGRCRGRKIHFPDIEHLRPTPNRIRETLFNWLAPFIQGASCLDLFAGSGALSFEAMSRGARYCLVLDSSREIVQSLLENRSLLGFSNMDIVQASFPYPANILKESFDIVFLDPPFYQGYLQVAIDWLHDCLCLKSNSLIYVESESHEDIICLPKNWYWLKDKKAGNVHYSLIRVEKV